MAKHIINYLVTNVLIWPEQYGFRGERSAVDASESIINSVDKGDITKGIFMDLTKSMLQCMPH